MKIFIALAFVVALVAAAPIDNSEVIEKLLKQGSYVVAKTKHVIEQFKAAKQEHRLAMVELELGKLEQLLTELHNLSGKPASVSAHELAALEEKVLALQNRLSEELEAVQLPEEKHPEVNDKAKVLAFAQEVHHQADLLMAEFPVTHNEETKLMASISAKLAHMIEELKAKTALADVVATVLEISAYKNALTGLGERLRARTPAMLTGEETLYAFAHKVLSKAKLLSVKFATAPEHKEIEEIVHLLEAIAKEVVAKQPNAHLVQLTLSATKLEAQLDALAAKLQQPATQD